MYRKEHFILFYLPLTLELVVIYFIMKSFLFLNLQVFQNLIKNANKSFIRNANIFSYCYQMLKCNTADFIFQIPSSTYNKLVSQW
jgi:hypothetical protein